MLLIVYKERRSLLKLYFFPQKSLDEIQRLSTSPGGERLTERGFLITFHG